MYTLKLTEDQTTGLKKLLAIGPVTFSSMTYTYDNGEFVFQNKSDFKLIKEAVTQLFKIDEENDLAATLAQAIMKGKDEIKPKVNQLKTPQEKATDEIASNIETALEKNPRMKTDMERAAKQAGIKLESLSVFEREVLKSSLAETKDLNKAVFHTRSVTGNTLVETVLDDITSRMMEYFVALKAQNVKSISLKKLARQIDKSKVINIDPTQDMEFFVDLVASLPVVQKVNPDKDKVYLELANDPEIESGPEEDEQEEELIDRTATNKAKQNIKQKDKDAKEAAGNLFASYNPDGQLVENTNLEVLTFEVAEKLSDILSAKGWDGTDGFLLRRGIQEIEKDYPGIDKELLKIATIDMFKQYHSISGGNND